MSRLNAKQIMSNLERIPKWAKQSAGISRTFVFKGFLDGLRFVNLIGQIAEKNNHHPDINIRWNKVKLIFTTHDVGGISEKDFALAKKCDAVFSNSFENIGAK